MNSKILINAVDTEECRIAKVTDSKLEEFHIESATREITHGNIYKGVITRIEPSLQAVFVEYGAERHGFLQKQEIHPDYHQDHREGDHAIQHLVKKGQEIMVQVEKDPINRKGAMLTTYISLPGRFVVLMPGSDSRGISRKIESDEERSRLKEILAGIKVPEDFGLIVRTAGDGCTKTMITKDLNYLLRLWKSIRDMVMKVSTPAALYKERNLVLRSLRDYFTPDVDEVLIDDAAVYQEARKFMQVISPKQTQSVKHYKGAKPIFTKFQLEEQIASIYESRVGLKSGGSIVIDQTEALVAIDVNSGKATQQRSIEETALQTNLEAAEEIARQLRLRDLGGLIVLDFIDMRETRNRNNVERALKEHLKVDKARTRLGRISKFGLLEMSRQRIRPSIIFGGYTTCPRCGGRGLTPTVETLGVAFLRQLSLQTLKTEIAAARCEVPIPVASYLLNRKRRELLDIEQRRDITISVEGLAHMEPGDSRIHLEARSSGA